ncbi:MAG TPA: CBS domain-containing protein [Terriglobales bacterium]|nr:CBS domain-containing protein [Terriglobales bacterium]
MPTIYDLVKGHETTVAQVGQTVCDVARVMVEHNIGAVPVLQDGQLAGIFSERDLMRRVVVECRDPKGTRVEEVMTTEPVVVSPTTSIEECMVIMRNHGFRHLPICEGTKLKGLVSLRDLLLRDLSEKDDEVRMMRAYIHAVPGM